MKLVFYHLFDAEIFLLGFDSKMLSAGHLILSCAFFSKGDCG